MSFWDGYVVEEDDEINLDIDIFDTSNSDLNKETTKLKKRFDCVEIGCPNNNGFGYSTFNNLQVHRRDKHNIVLRPKMSNKVFSLNCESIMKAHTSMVKQNITGNQLMNYLKDQYSENTVADVKRELSTFKSKCTEQIDKQQFTIESLPDFSIENDSMHLVIQWVKVMKSEDFDKFQIFVNHLLQRKKLRQLELDENFLKAKEVLVTMGEASGDVILMSNMEREFIIRLMQENEELKAKVAASKNSESTSSASSPPGESTSFIGMVGEALGVSSGNKRQRAED